MKFKEVIKKMRAAGWKIKNVKGSHYHLIHDSRPGVKVQVPRHLGDLPLKTLHNIKKATGLDF
jgi:predicted RNA binding protein YcfA (HicA-like mRNA interferase family)